MSECFNADTITVDNFEGFIKARKLPFVIDALPINFAEGFVVTTREGVMKGKPGDYLIIGIEGEKYPIAKAIFEKSYEVLSGDIEVNENAGVVESVGVIRRDAKTRDKIEEPLDAELTEGDVTAEFIGTDAVNQETDETADKLFNLLRIMRAAEGGFGNAPRSRIELGFSGVEARPFYAAAILPLYGGGATAVGISVSDAAEKLCEAVKKGKSFNYESKQEKPG